MRSKRAIVRELPPDLKYGSTKVARLINYIMFDGKKSVAQKQVYLALEQLEDQTGKNALDMLDEVLRTVTPQWK